MVPNVPELDGYTFEPANHPDNATHGGVGLFYKNSLPNYVGRDLSFSESIVIKLKFGRKNIFLPCCTEAHRALTSLLNFKIL